mgnify:CR=1 FL=1
MPLDEELVVRVYWGRGRPAPGGGVDILALMGRARSERELRDALGGSVRELLFFIHLCRSGHPKSNLAMKERR